MHIQTQPDFGCVTCSICDSIACPAHTVRAYAKKKKEKWLVTFYRLFFLDSKQSILVWGPRIGVAD